MVSQVDCEIAEGNRHPAVRRHETEALRIDERNDRKRCPAVGQIDAAYASVVLDQHAQEVLVCDALRVGR